MIWHLFVQVNGASGIGTGWATDVPMYNPRDLCRILKLLLTTPIEDHGALNIDSLLQPWYNTSGLKRAVY